METIHAAVQAEGQTIPGLKRAKIEALSHSDEEREEDTSNKLLDDTPTFETAEELLA